MNKKEFATLSVGLKAAYPRFSFLLADEDMDFWYLMLQDIDYSVAENAALEYISTRAFPPSIAEIRKLCVERTARAILSFDEAWGLVVKARNQFGRDEPLKAYALMDELTVAVVKNLGWYQICTSTNDESTRANFREAYEARAKAAQNSLQLPEFVARQKLQIQERFAPVLESKAAPRIEEQIELAGTREKTSEEQLAQRSQMLEETKRRLLSGKAE